MWLNISDKTRILGPHTERLSTDKLTSSLSNSPIQGLPRYAKAKQHVDSLKQSILAKAFRGELVPQDPNDEPASALLESIQQARGTKVK